MWLISIAAWGEHYRHKLIAGALPSINAAIDYAKADVKFISHTDSPEAFDDVVFNGAIEFRPVHPVSCAYTSYGNCDRDVLDRAPEGCYIAFLTSDIIISREFFANAEKRFAEGKRAIVGSAARTLVDPAHCPAGFESRALLDWSFSHKHPVTEGCFWARGRNLVTWCLYFEGPHGTVARAFHLHPFAVVNDRYLFFQRETVDLDLLERFTHDEIHVVTDADECSFAEISGLEKTIPHREPLCIGSVISWAIGHTTELQRWLFANHRIVVSGTGEDNLDIEPCNEISRILG
jgi:hypothetical protein